MWKKDDEVLGFKAVSDPKVFNENCQTVIWKSKGENGYFVSVHDKNGTLTNFKWHPNKGSSEPPVEIHPTLQFERMLSALLNNNVYADFNIIAFDVTSEDTAFDTVWKNLLYRFSFIDKVPWSNKGTRFMVNMLLEAHYEREANKQPTK